MENLTYLLVSLQHILHILSAYHILLQIFEHVDMVTTDILATFLMAAAAQQCKRRAAVVAMVNQSHSCGLAPDLPTDIPVESSAACFGNRSVYLNPTCTQRVTRIP